MADPTHDERGRRIIDADIVELMRAMKHSAPEDLGHVDPDRVLVVAGAARRAANASIRPLTYGGDPPKRTRGRFLKPSITVGGIAMRYEICLRPRFFLHLDPEERARVLAHELWHASSSFDGTLDPDRRHHGTGAKGASDVDRIVAAWLDAGAPRRDAVTYDDEIRVRAWVSRPPSRIPRDAGMRDTYDERDLFYAAVVVR